MRYIGVDLLKNIENVGVEVTLEGAGVIDQNNLELELIKYEIIREKLESLMDHYITITKDYLLGRAILEVNKNNEKLLNEIEIILKKKKEDETMNLNVIKLISKNLEKMFYRRSSNYLRQVMMYNMVFIKMKYVKRNIFISIENNEGRLIYSYSYGRMFKRARERYARFAHKDIGKKIGEFLKKSQIKRAILCVYDLRKTWGKFKGFKFELYNYVRIVGTYYMPRWFKGKRKLKRHKRKKGTRRFR